MKRCVVLDEKQLELIVHALEQLEGTEREEEASDLVEMFHDLLDDEDADEHDINDFTL